MGTLAADLKAARRGDWQAFNRLVAARQEQLYTFTYRALGEEQAAVEAAQAAVAQAAANLRRLGEERFHVWILRWAVAACQARQRHVGSAPPNQENAQGPAWAWQRGLCRLTFDLRVAIILVDVMGLDYTEAAAVLGLSDEQVCKQVAGARRRLIGQSPEQAWATS